MGVTHILFIKVNKSSIAGTLANHTPAHVMWGAWLEPWRSVVHIQDSDCNSCGGTITFWRLCVLKKCQKKKHPNAKEGNCGYPPELGGNYYCV